MGDVPDLVSSLPKGPELSSDLMSHDSPILSEYLIPLVEHELEVLLSP